MVRIMAAAKASRILHERVSESIDSVLLRVPCRTEKLRKKTLNAVHSAIRFPELYFYDAEL